MREGLLELGASLVSTSELGPPNRNFTSEFARIRTFEKSVKSLKLSGRWGWLFCLRQDLRMPRIASKICFQISLDPLRRLVLQEHWIPGGDVHVFKTLKTSHPISLNYHKIRVRFCGNRFRFDSANVLGKRSSGCFHFFTSWLDRCRQIQTRRHGNGWWSG